MAQDKILTFSDYADEQFDALQDARGKTYREWLAYLFGIFHQGAELPPVPDGFASRAFAYIDAGRWIWECPFCESALPVEVGEPSICVMCASGGWFEIILPDNRVEIEDELLKQPGRRLASPIRYWYPHWTFADIQERTAKAIALIASGENVIRALSIGATRTWTTGEILTAANLNTFNRDVLRDLAGRDGRIDLENAIRVKLGTSHTVQPFAEIADQYIGLPLLTSDPVAGEGRLTYRSDTNRVRFYDGSQWSNLALDSSLPQPSNQNPRTAGTAAPGTSARYARQDHVHPTQPVPQPSNQNPRGLGTAAQGSSARFSRQDHVHAAQTIPTVPNASTTQSGIVELATDSETQAGTDSDRAVTPAALLARVNVLTQAEYDALAVKNTDTVYFVT